MFLIDMRSAFSRASPRPLKTSRWTPFTMASALAATLLVGAAGPNTQAAPHELPMHAIVNGHNVQPRKSELQALGTPDTTSTESAEIDELYRQLMQEHHGDTQQLS
jgi:hypothetical protein